MILNLEICCIVLLDANVLPCYNFMTRDDSANKLQVKKTISSYCILLFITLHMNRFDFCSTENAKSPVENLGQVVFGERIRPSPYDVRKLMLLSLLEIYVQH